MLIRYNALPSLLIIEWAAYLLAGSTKNDIRIFIIWIVYRFSPSLYYSLSEANAHDLWSYLLLVTFALLLFVSFFKPFENRHLDHNYKVCEDKRLKPLILPCRTTHTRVFPKKHGFSYSYLQVGIPVGWRGSIASILSVDTDTPKTWFNVGAADFLDRGNGQLSLRGKLDAYLKSQRELVEDYPKAYLVTAPRFLGYSFNPVSFWYLYSDDMRLTAMILEVNNTFDERRMYFMKQSKVDNEVEVANERATRFTNRWTKDFHVSPFNSRKGSYSLSALDPFATSEALANVDNTITLSSSKDHAKLVARIFTTDPPVDPSIMTVGSKIQFILSWWWVGFVTFPRIVKEAGKLFFQRKLHVWFRPEVNKTSIGRNESYRERSVTKHRLGDEKVLTEQRIIEKCFRHYLRHQVRSGDPKQTQDENDSAKETSSMRYIASGANCLREETFALPPYTNPTSTREESVLQILTPLFYTELALHSDPSTFIYRAMEYPAERQICHAYPVDGISSLLKYNISGPVPSGESYLASLRWGFLHLFRCQRSLHPLDQFVRTSLPNRLAEEYRRAVVSLVVSSRLTFGIPELLDGLGFLFRIALCWLCLDAVWDKATMATIDVQEAVLGDWTWLIGLLYLWLQGEGWLVASSRV